MTVPNGSEVKNLPIMSETQETRVQSLGREDPLQEEMATHSSILAWAIPWTEEPGKLQSKGPEESNTTEQSNHFEIIKKKKNVYYNLQTIILNTELTKKFVWVFPYHPMEKLELFGQPNSSEFIHFHKIGH